MKLHFVLKDNDQDENVALIIGNKPPLINDDITVNLHYKIEIDSIAVLLKKMQAALEIAENCAAFSIDYDFDVVSKSIECMNLIQDLVVLYKKRRWEYGEEIS